PARPPVRDTTAPILIASGASTAAPSVVVGSSAAVVGVVPSAEVTGAPPSAWVVADPVSPPHPAITMAITTSPTNIARCLMSAPSSRCRSSVGRRRSLARPSQQSPRGLAETTREQEDDDDEEQSEEHDLELVHVRGHEVATQDEEDRSQQRAGESADAADEDDEDRFEGPYDAEGEVRVVAHAEVGEGAAGHRGHGCADDE